MSSAVSAVRFLGPDTDAYVASVQRHSAEFEEQTGVALEALQRLLKGGIRRLQRAIAEPQLARSRAREG